MNEIMSFLFLTLRGRLTLITYRLVLQLVNGRSVFTNDRVHRNSAQVGVWGIVYVVVSRCSGECRGSVPSLTSASVRSQTKNLHNFGYMGYVSFLSNFLRSHVTLVTHLPLGAFVHAVCTPLWHLAAVLRLVISFGRGGGTSTTIVVRAESPYEPCHMLMQVGRGTEQGTDASLPDRSLRIDAHKVPTVLVITRNNNDFPKERHPFLTRAT
ncbi:hypothetical protein EDB87DRAFT_203207 [Lactarius vividus]|nr:hypothetical protein EDB87DRAFT_203207 [Lactarius vividus]